MAQFIRNHAPVFIAVGTGAVIGASIIVCYQKIADDTSRQLRELAAKIQVLCREIELLKNTVEASTLPKKKRLSGYYSIHASSGDDDDDDYEEALEEAELFDCAPTPPLVADVTGEALSVGETSEAAHELYQRVDELLEGSDNDKTQAYDLLCAKEKELIRDAEFMWRYAKATYMVAAVRGARDGDEAKKEAIYKAHDQATRALHLNTASANVHKWYAITTTGVGDYESTQVKLQNGLKYKEHIQKAIELNPKDASAYYLLGRWLYAVYMLSWIERQAAATLFGSSISARVEDALSNFMEAEKLDPGNWKDNLLQIAKCHIELRDYYVAVTWLDKAKTVPTISQEDKAAQRELDNLLYKYGGYRR